MSGSQCWERGILVRLSLYCLSAIVPVRLSKGALTHCASREFGVMIITITWGPVAKSNSKAVQCLRSLSKASNPITQLEQHLHISKPQVNQIKYDYKP